MSGKVVVGTSLALKWVVAEADSSLARELLSSWIANGYDIIAPSLYASEVANALHQKARRGLISPDEAKRYLADLVLAGPTLDCSLDAAINLALSNRALELAQRHGLPARFTTRIISRWRSARAVSIGPPTSACGIACAVRLGALAR
jgi:predicted nucleic acid-binding protein